MTCPSDDELARLADGDASDTERAEIEAHLDGCAECARAMSELGSLLTAGASLPGYRILDEVAPGRWLVESRDGARGIAYAGLESARALVGVSVPGVTTVLAVEDGVIVSAVPPGPIATTPAAWRAAIAAVGGVHARGGIHGGISPSAIRDEVAEVGARVDDPAFVAPEVRAGASPSARGDQFALCTGLWEALVGHRPYAGTTPGALAVTTRAPLELPATGDRAVLSVLARGLDPDPARRWPDLDALARALDAPPAPSRWPLVGRALAIAAIVVTACAAVWLMFAWT